MIHDRREEIGGADDRLLAVDPVDGSIVRRGQPDQQIGMIAGIE
jgi:hypothetical protein